MGGEQAAEGGADGAQSVDPNRRLRAILDAVTDGLAVLGPAQEVREVNARFLELFSLGTEQVACLGRVEALLGPEGAIAFGDHWACALAGRISHFECTVRRVGGDLPVEVILSPLADWGEPAVLATFRDPSLRQRADPVTRLVASIRASAPETTGALLPDDSVLAALRLGGDRGLTGLPDGGLAGLAQDTVRLARGDDGAELAEDEVTRLPNRAAFDRYFRDQIARCREWQTELGVLVLGIDRLPSVPQMPGRPATVKLLRAMADRLRVALRSEDLVAQRGTDEFAVVLPGVDLGLAERVAQRLIREVGRPWETDGRTLILELKAGIALCPRDGDQPEVLLERAERALRHARESGRNLAVSQRH